MLARTSAKKTKKPPALGKIFDYWSIIIDKRKNRRTLSEVKDYILTPFSSIFERQLTPFFMMIRFCRFLSFPFSCAAEFPVLAINNSSPLTHFKIWYCEITIEYTLQGQAQVVQRMDRGIHWRNHYPLNNLDFDSTHQLSSDLSSTLTRFSSFKFNEAK